MFAGLAAIVLLVLPARGNDWRLWSFVIGCTTTLVAFAQRLRALLRSGRHRAAHESSTSALDAPPWPVAAIGVILSCAWVLVGIAAAAAGDVWLTATAITAALIVGTGSVSGFAWAWSAGREQRIEIPLGIALANVPACCVFWLPRLQPDPALTVYLTASATTLTLTVGSWVWAAVEHPGDCSCRL
jgi:hypothetical protein